MFTGTQAWRASAGQSTHPQSRLAIEVDGPSHFLHASQVPRGETLMKRRHLASQGLLVVPVPYWEWSALELMPISARVEYLRERLAG